MEINAPSYFMQRIVPLIIKELGPQVNKMVGPIIAEKIGIPLAKKVGLPIAKKIGIPIARKTGIILLNKVGYPLINKVLTQNNISLSPSAAKVISEINTTPTKEIDKPKNKKIKNLIKANRGKRRGLFRPTGQSAVPTGQSLTQAVPPAAPQITPPATLPATPPTAPVNPPQAVAVPQAAAQTVPQNVPHLNQGNAGNSYPYSNFPSYNSSLFGKRRQYQN
ncbi:MAG: hypothetical protein GX207_07940 [Peptococcaceae bacterium]|nr:hypothetical protein [Peptococcaceae bacterium]